MDTKELTANKSTETEELSNVIGKDDTEYKPLSALAISAFFLSFTAPLVFFHPILAAIPVVAVGLAMIGIVKIQNSPNQLAGTKLAHLAVMIAVGISAMAITYQTSRSNLVYSRAQQFAENWFEFIRIGDVPRAHQLTILASRRVNKDHGDHLEAYYDKDFVLVNQPDEKSKNPYSSIKVFSNQLPVREIRGAGEDCKYKFLGRDYGSYFSEMDREIFGLEYQLTPNIYHKDKPLHFKIFLERRRFEDTGVQWRIVDKKYIDGGPDIKKGTIKQF